jgi:hypothetical protein
MHEMTEVCILRVLLYCEGDKGVCARGGQDGWKMTVNLSSVV